MTNKFVQAFLLFIVVLVLAGFSIVIKNQTPAFFPTPQTITRDDANTSTPSSKVTLSIDRYYDSQANTYTGSVMAAEPCAVLDTKIDVEESQPEKINLILETKSGGQCENGSQKKDFIIVVPSSEQAKIEQIVFNGELMAFKVHSD